jgi:hypothetical protein
LISIQSSFLEDSRLYFNVSCRFSEVLSKLPVSSPAFGDFTCIFPR